MSQCPLHVHNTPGLCANIIPTIFLSSLWSIQFFKTSPNVKLPK